MCRKLGFPAVQVEREQRSRRPGVHSRVETFGPPAGSPLPTADGSPADIADDQAFRRQFLEVAGFEFRAEADRPAAGEPGR